jgi:hypothetical protein
MIARAWRSCASLSSSWRRESDRLAGDLDPPGRGLCEDDRQRQGLRDLGPGIGGVDLDLQALGAGLAGRALGAVIADRVREAERCDRGEIFERRHVLQRAGGAVIDADRPEAHREVKVWQDAVLGDLHLDGRALLELRQLRQIRTRGVGIGDHRLELPVTERYAELGRDR